MATNADAPIKKTIKTPRKKTVSDLQDSIHTDSMNTFSSQACCNSTHKVRWILVIILLLANIVLVWCVRQTIVWLETMKVGGEENYEKMKIIMESESYKQNYTQQLDMMLQQMQNPTDTIIPSLSTEDTTETIIDEDSSNTSLPLNEAEQNGDI